MISLPNSRKTILISLVALAALLNNQALAQFPEKLKNGLKTYLDKNDSSRYIQLQMVGQFWVRNTDNNPYTGILSNSAGTNQYTVEKSTTDFSIRRIRFVLSGSL